MNTSKKQNAKKERMSEIISEEILGAKTFVHSLYPGHEETYQKYTILKLEIEGDTILFDLSDSNGITKYTLCDFKKCLNRETGDFYTFEHGEISFFSYHSKAEYEAKLAEREAKFKAAIAECEAALPKIKKN